MFQDSRLAATDADGGIPSGSAGVGPIEWPVDLPLDAVLIPTGKPVPPEKRGYVSVETPDVPDKEFFVPLAAIRWE